MVLRLHQIYQQNACIYAIHKTGVTAHTMMRHTWHEKLYITMMREIQDGSLCYFATTQLLTPLLNIVSTAS